MKTVTNTVATIAATLLMSTTLIVAAVGPAQADSGAADGGKAPVASTLRSVA